MATSIQTCLPNSCKNQHQMKAVTKSPNVIRRSGTRQNSANRRSAVERLEESKANYVKSERVLDTKQEFKNSSHLCVSNAPQLDLLFKVPAKQSHDNIRLTNSSDELKLSYLRLQHQSGNQLSISPPVARTRAKSYSEFRDAQITRKHSFASQGRRNRIEVLIDIESQLKQLITSGSRENVSMTHESIVSSTAHAEAQFTSKTLKTGEVPKVRRGYSDPIRKSCWTPPDLSIETNNCIHKSMPDLSPSPCTAQIPCSSLSSGDSNDVPHSETAGCVQYMSSNHTVAHYSTSVSQDSEKDEDVFDSYKGPRRFSNGTGMLHLTPYYSASSQLQRRPVSRSKSDVSHRYSKRGSEYFPRRNNYTSAEIERFFDTMGLDTNVWHHITSPSSVSSPPCFFESVSSVDSNEDRSSVCSDDSVPEPPREGLRNQDLRVHGPLETSIVEKNARVIKWLYNCRKAAYDS
ncbi:uncharacterized protein LOC129963879 [Argiope bruennichi]|uniref:uncharacterized protein LOC129963879 n=1 Tax=Argiope bruennichi TaxID=94029 RepID=UPI0024950558|nr:uncharacterized protein LOC129963879 [Argiope bruennichi]XP_055934436.1 uncharacterized protein LOC129963879 [Argiope bruennichi]XP_055934437.1 uncharacterized protein LOC129963879 [Argiope bruennichi]